MVTWGLSRELFDQGVARLAALVVAVSPGVWLLAGSRMAHTTVLLALGIAALVVVRGRDGCWSWVGAGLAVAYVVLARPFDALLVGAPLLVWGMVRAGTWSRRGLLLAPSVLAVLLLGWDNQQLTGEPWVFPVNVWYDAWSEELGRVGCNRLGFGPEIGCAPTLGSYGHSPLKALLLAGEAGLRLERLLLGMPGGGLLVLAGLWRSRKSRGSRLGLILVSLVVLGHAFYWSPGRAYGARFWHPLYLVLPAWIACGLSALPTRRSGLAWGVACLVGGSFVVRDLADRYWCVDGALGDALNSAGVEEGVVFLAARGERSTAWPALGVSGFTCDPMLEAGDGMSLLDPTRTSGGIQVRHALPDGESMQLYMERHQPGSAAWLVTHDLPSDTRTLTPLLDTAP
jgi:hypothetical protein